MRYHTNLKFIVFVVLGFSLSHAALAEEDALNAFQTGYHGMLVDRSGKEIPMNAEILVKTQNHYIQLLVKQSDEETAKEVSKIGEFLKSSKQISDRERAHIKGVLIDVLIKKLKSKNAERFLEKNQALKRVINSNFKPNYKLKKVDRISVSRDTISYMKKSTGSGSNAALNAIFEAIIEAFIQLLNDFLASNDDYQNECILAGVPMPPDWNSGDWDFKGELTDEFIGSSAETQVYTYNSNTPRGACVALPRIDYPGNAGAFGVICMGEDSENACFWDGANIDVNDQFRIQDRLLDGQAMANLGGGECTDCHAGENAFVSRQSPSILNFNNLNINSSWYTPLGVPSSWSQNPGPTTLLNNVDTAYTGSFGSSHSGESCLQCHQFPEVAELPSYCEFVLKKSAKNTMPSESDPSGWGWPNSSDYRKHIKALRQACP